MVDLILIIILTILLIIYISFKGKVDISVQTDKKKWALKGKDGHFKYTKEEKENEKKESRRKSRNQL